jgi:hypothetical protein
LEQTIQITLREEVNITNQDRSKKDNWLQLFDKHGALFSENGVQSTRIPLDNVDVLDLLPEQAKPIIVEKSYKVFEIAYELKQRRYDLIYYPDNKVLKKINILLENSDFSVSYLNMNNEEFKPMVMQISGF